VASLDEGFEETLTLHRLGLSAKLGISLMSTERARVDFSPPGDLRAYGQPHHGQRRGKAVVVGHKSPCIASGTKCPAIRRAAQKW